MGIAESHWQAQAFYLSSQPGQTKRRPHPGGRRESIQIVAWLNREGAQYWKSGNLSPRRKLGEENTLCKLLEEFKYSKCALWSCSLLRALESGSPGSVGLRSRRRFPRREREIHSHSPVQSKPSPCTDISGEELSCFFRKLNGQQNPILFKDCSVKMEHCVFTLLLIEKSTQIINKC